MAKDERRTFSDSAKRVELPYVYENGTAYVPPVKRSPPFIPDRGFDGPA
jgi:hypothetical protein